MIKFLSQGAAGLGILILVALQVYHSVLLSGSNVRDDGTDSFLTLDVVSALSQQPSTKLSSSSSSCDPRSHIFDPFSDIQFKIIESGSKVAYSSVHCVGTGTTELQLQSEADSFQGRRPNFVSRTCQYRNLYYRWKDQTFHYFSSPLEATVREKSREIANVSAPDLWQGNHNSTLVHNASAEEFMARTEVSLGHVNEFLPKEKLSEKHIVPWKPQQHEETFVGRAARVQNSDSVFLLYQPYHSYKLSHFVWDDLLSLFSLMDAFYVDATRVQPIPLFVELANTRNGVNHGGRDRQFRCSPYHSPKWKDCVKTYRKFFPSLFGIATDCSGDILRTGNFLLPEGVGVWKKHSKEHCSNSTQTNQAPKNADYILLPTVLAGTGRLNEFGCDADCSIGRGPQFYRFRQFLLHHLLGPEPQCQSRQKPSRGYITFSLPIGSSRPDKVTMFESEILWARQRYGSGVVKVVNLSNMTIHEQVDLMLNTAVFVTNHGGGSFVSLFLPRNSGVLLFWHDKRLDHNFYESAGFFRTTWVSMVERRYINRTTSLIELEFERTRLANL